jgi:hypothetical protein
MKSKQRQRLISMVNDHIKVADDEERVELEQLVVALLGVHVEPEPLGPIENIGSCEPSPLIRWNKTQNTWHTDVGKVGRYSVRRLAPRQPWAAFLNGKRLGNDSHTDVSVMKRVVERRIHTARRINEATDS